MSTPIPPAVRARIQEMRRLEAEEEDFSPGLIKAVLAVVLVVLAAMIGEKTYSIFKGEPLSAECRLWRSQWSHVNLQTSLGMERLNENECAQSLVKETEESISRLETDGKFFASKLDSPLEEGTKATFKSELAKTKLEIAKLKLKLQRTQESCREALEAQIAKKQAVLAAQPKNCPQDA
jgi:hypothetical protein